MKKVVAFLEKYAEWVAMSFACVFLLYMVYAYIVSPDDLRIPVGNETLMPGDVDPHINNNLLAGLEKEISNPKSDVEFPVPDFKQGFALNMSKDRPHMKPEDMLASAFRPGIAPVGPVPDGPNQTGQPVTALPVALAPLFTAFNAGASLVKVPAPGAAAAAAAAAPGAVAANVPEVDKTWIMGEFRIDVKGQAAEWKKALFDAKGNSIVPTAVLATQFLRVEVERQEQIEPGVWTAPVAVVQPAIAEMMEYPKVGDRTAEEEYRLWTEKHQVDIVEPSFYQVVKGDDWFIPSQKAKEKEGVAAAEPAAKEGPFDPANPPKDRELTADEKAKVYLYRQKEAAEKQKQEAAARKAKADSTRKPATPSGGGTGESGGGRRKIGGYAPLPGEGRVPGQRYDDAGRPIGRPTNPTRPGFDRGMTPRGEGSGRPAPGRERFNNTGPVGGLQNPALSGPFDPTMLIDPQGNASDIILWFHDDTVVPGKTYRYRVKISLKNPIYLTQNLTKNPAFETQLAIASDWSAWTPSVKAPPTTEFFVSRAVRPINGANINKVTIDVFKHEKGDWAEATFEVSPGDGIGSVKNNVDFATGITLVDIRGDIRDKDTKILVADDKGSLAVLSFETQKNDPRYQTLKQKVKDAATPGPAAEAGSPPLINR
jgi:hypothetical protein